MHRKPSENKFENYENDAEVMMNIARSEIKSLITENVDLIYAERTETETQSQI